MGPITRNARKVLNDSSNAKRKTAKDSTNAQKMASNQKVLSDSSKTKYKKANDSTKAQMASNQKVSNDSSNAKRKKTNDSTKAQMTTNQKLLSDSSNAKRKKANDSTKAQKMASNQKVSNDSKNAKRKMADDSRKTQRASKRSTNYETDSSNDELPPPIFGKKARTITSNSMSTTEKPKEHKASIEKESTSTDTTISKKAINAKLAHATRPELTKLLKKINKDFPAVGRAVFANHRPENEPLVPLPDDPLMKKCFHCSQEQELYHWYGLMACEFCKKCVFNKTETCQWFGFSKSQADQLKRTEDYNGMYGGIRYRYKADTIVKAIKERDGCMFKWLISKDREHRGFSRPEATPTLEKLDAAPTKTEKNKVLTRDLKHTTDMGLVVLVYEVIGGDRKLTLQGGIIDKFVPAKLPGLSKELG